MPDRDTTEAALDRTAEALKEAKALLMQRPQRRGTFRTTLFLDDALAALSTIRAALSQEEAPPKPQMRTESWEVDEGLDDEGE